MISNKVENAHYMSSIERMFLLSYRYCLFVFVFFFQAEDGIRDLYVTGVQTCALPILYEMLGFEKVAKLIERNVIEIAPLAYMRGRTLNDSYVILDEAQNTTVEQMKMFLTRIGFGSVAVITGDVSQVDLPRHVRSGLRHAVEVLRGVDGISFTFFTSRDVVRHPLVAKIVRAYEAFEQAPEGQPSGAARPPIA